LMLYHGFVYVKRRYYRMIIVIKPKINKNKINNEYVRELARLLANLFEQLSADTFG
jgi:hypothetical protein